MITACRLFAPIRWQRESVVRGDGRRAVLANIGAAWKEANGELPVGHDGGEEVCPQKLHARGVPKCREQR